MATKLVSGQPLTSTIDCKTVKKMVYAYRLTHRSDPYALKFTQFDIVEVLKLFVENKILSQGSFDNVIKENGDLSNHGMKIYLGTHTEIEDCPDRHRKFLNHDTPILCTTKLVESKDEDNNTVKKWVDMLEDNEDSIIYSYSAKDKTYPCPPTCDGDQAAAGAYVTDIYVK